MSDEPTGAASESRPRVAASVVLFWVGYVALTLAVGFATASAIRAEVWQLTAGGFANGAGLLVLSRILGALDREPRTDLDRATRLPG